MKKFHASIMKYCFAGLLLCLSFLLVNCHKSNNSPIPISDSLLTHFSFKTGSYWIYYDSVNSATDSFYVDTNYTNTYVSNSDEILRKMNVVKILIASNSVDSIGDWNIILHDSTMDIIHNYLAIKPFTVYPFRTEITANLDTTNVSGPYPTFNLKGTSFQNVYEITHSYTDEASSYYPQPEYYDQYYLNDSIGFIYMNLGYPTGGYPNNVWELERYHIIK